MAAFVSATACSAKAWEAYDFFMLFLHERCHAAGCCALLLYSLLHIRPVKSAENRLSRAFRVLRTVGCAVVMNCR